MSSLIALSPNIVTVCGIGREWSFNIWILGMVCGVCVCVCVFSHVWDPMDCSPPDSSVHGIFPGKNTEADCHFLLQGIFLSQGLNPFLVHLLHWQWVLYLGSLWGWGDTISSITYHIFQLLILQDSIFWESFPWTLQLLTPWCSHNTLLSSIFTLTVL